MVFCPSYQYMESARRLRQETEGRWRDDKIGKGRGEEAAGAREENAVSLLLFRRADG